MSNELKEFPLFKSLWLKIKEPDKTALIIVNDDGSDERITYAGLLKIPTGFRDLSSKPE
ncbi:MAG: hypothetical protein WA096_07685 [Smithella sp.]|jgi:hypothetical protein